MKSRNDIFLQKTEKIYPISMDNDIDNLLIPQAIENSQKLRKNDLFLKEPVKMYPSTIEEHVVSIPVDTNETNTPKFKRSELRKKAEALIERNNKPIGLLDMDKSSSALNYRNRSKSSSNVVNFVSADQLFKLNQLSHIGGETMLDLVYLPIKKNLLGKGRHASVYTGYVRSNKVINDKIIQGPEVQCAVKVLEHSAESSISGLMEAYTLNMLKHHNIVRIFGFMDYQDKMGHGTIHTEIPLDDLRSINADVLMKQCDIFKGNLLFEIPDEASFIDLTPNKNRLLILEYAKGGSLWDFCQKSPRLITKRQFLRWCKEIASALILTQERNIIHHDIKPGNILLSDFNVTKLSDFGNAVICTPATCRLINDKLSLPIEVSRGRGTTVFQAPELFSTSTQSYDNTVDIYSFGATLWTCGILGREPFGRIQSVAMLHQIIQRGFLLSELNWPPEILHSELQDSEICAVFPDKLDIKDAKGIYNPYNGRVLRFLNGEVVDIWIYELLRDCLSLNSQERPSPKEFLYRIKLNDGGLDSTDFFL